MFDDVSEELSWSELDAMHVSVIGRVMKEEGGGLTSMTRMTSVGVLMTSYLK